MVKRADIDFLFEVGTLRFVQRTWRQFLGSDFSNVSEHSYRVIWTALLLAKAEGATNTEKIMRMALVHDLSESRTGDVHYLSRIYTTRDEDRAIADTLGKTQLKEFIDVWREYEKLESLEARIVKDADTLDVELELREQEMQGVQLKKLWAKRRRAQVRFHKLHTKSAKLFWDAIEKGNPHSWHFNAPNRHTAGDWQRADETSKRR